MKIWIVYEQTGEQEYEACSAFTNEVAAEEYARREHECILSEEGRDAKMVVCEVPVYDTVEESDTDEHLLVEK